MDETMVQISGMKQRKVVTLEEAKRAYAKEGHKFSTLPFFFLIVGAIRYEFIVKKDTQLFF